MKKIVLFVGFAFAAIFTPLAQAQIISLTLDPAQSSVNVSIAASPLGVSSSSSPLSGTTTIDIQNLGPPSGTAQITQLDIVLDDSLNFSLGLGLFSVSVSSAPGDVTLSMVNPGTPGTIANSSFDQLDNEIVMSGDFNVADPFGLAGGNQTIDLSTIMFPPLDISSISVTQSGDTITVSNAFTVSQVTEFGLLEAEVTYVASGLAPRAVILGDANLDGVTTFLDIAPFIAVLSATEFQSEADCNEDGLVNFLDISFFIDILSGQSQP